MKPDHVKSSCLRGSGFVAMFIAASLVSTLPALASPGQCASLWIERNTPFAQAGLCVDTPLWKSVFPNGSCTYTSGAEISLPDDVAARLTEIRAQEAQWGCRIDSGFGDAEIAARSLWLDVGDQGSIFSAKDGYANLRDAPSAKSGNLIGRMDNGGRVEILERVQSPDNGALWFRVSYADKVGKARNAYVHYASVFPRRDVTGTWDVAQSMQFHLVRTEGASRIPPTLLVRFWTGKHPSDIWPVLSHPTYSRAGEEQLTFSVAFSATEGWNPDGLAGAASHCQWQEGKQSADCSGKAGRFRIVAGRDEATQDLIALGLLLDSAPMGREPDSIIPAGFGGKASVVATRDVVQLAFAIDGLGVLKSGVVVPGKAPSPASAPATAAEPAMAEPVEAAQPVAAAPAEPSAALLPEPVSEAIGDFDALIDLME